MSAKTVALTLLILAPCAAEESAPSIQADENGMVFVVKVIHS